MKFVLFAAIVIASAILDLIGAKWTIYVQQKRAYRAGAMSMLWHTVNAAAILEYAHEPRLVVAVAIGGFIGTVIGIKTIKQLP